MGDEAKKKLNELKAMAERVAKAHNEQVANVWKEIEAVDEVKAALPKDYSDKYNLTFKDGVLFLEPPGSGQCTCLACVLTGGH